MNALSNSHNKHDRIFAAAVPLDDKVTAALEPGKVSALVVLADEFIWDITATRKTWCFSPRVSSSMSRRVCTSTNKTCTCIACL